MINFSSLPSTEAVLLNKEITLPPEVRFTFHENKDEQQLYKDLRKRLIALGASLEIDKEELASIQQATDSFIVAVEEKEEVLLYCNYFQRLYEVKEAIQSKSVDTKELAERFRTKIAPVQVCPMKDELIVELDALIDILPTEQVEHIQLTEEEQLAQKAIEQIGDAFINLGEVGQECVIKEVIEQFGTKVSIETVKERIIAIEKSLMNLAVVKESRELVHQLDQIPYTLFPTLSAERKGRVATKLLEINKWTNLASLNRMISLIDKIITSEELKQEKAKNTIPTLYGTATIDMKSIEDGEIEFNNYL